VTARTDARRIFSKPENPSADMPFAEPPRSTALTGARTALRTLGFRSLGLRTHALSTLALGVFLAGCTLEDRGATATDPLSSGGWSEGRLNDVSGVTWLEGELFLSVQDGKGPDAPRVTLLRNPTDRSGLMHQTLALPWPASDLPNGAPGGIAWDLESVARIPGTNRILLAESGDNGRGSQRLFLVEVTVSPDGTGATLALIETVPWPVSVFNVEATAVARVNDGYVFLYTERSQGEVATDVRWASVSFDPLSFGDFDGIPVSVPTTLGLNRPIVALEVTESGVILGAGSYDPDEDGGPFNSAVFRLGTLEAHADHPSGARLSLYPTPMVLGEMNGLKIEGIAVRERGNGAPFELFYGTDDEFYGGILRPLFPR